VYEAEKFLTRLIVLADGLPAAPAPGTGRAASIGALDASRIALAKWERMLSQAIARRGRHAAAMGHLERSISLLGHTMPDATLACKLEVLWGVGVRLAGRPRTTRRRRLSEEDQAACLESVRAYDSFIQFLYLGQTDGHDQVRPSGDTSLLSAVALLRSARLAERIGPSGELSRTYSLVANLMAMFRRSELADYYAVKARDIAETVHDKHALFRALTMGQLPAFISGRWHAAEGSFVRGLALGGELRNSHECLINECTLGYICFHQGRLDEALGRFTDIRLRAEHSEDQIPRLWATIAIAEVLFRQGQVREAMAEAQECLDLAERTGTVDQNSRFQAHRLLASAWARQGSLTRAMAEVAGATAAAGRVRGSPSSQAGFVGVAEALFAQWDRADRDQRGVETRLRRWLWLLRTTAFSRPILEPWDLFFGRPGIREEPPPARRASVEQGGPERGSDGTVTRIRGGARGDPTVDGVTTAGAIRRQRVCAPSPTGSGRAVDAGQD
jgi:tetratricopeptide (TPR) repeat protein